MNDRTIGDAPILSALPEAERTRIAEQMRLESHHSGDVLFRRGDQSTALYLVKAGWVRLLGEGGIAIASLGPHSLVGETDLFLDRPRTTGAALAGDAELWVLRRQDLLDLIAEDPQIGVDLSLAFGARLALLDRYLVERRLRPLPALAGLPDDALAAIAGRLVPVSKRRGELIVERGQMPQALFVVESGQVQVSGTAEGGDLQEVDPGQSFGELALLTGNPHGRSARAAGDTLLWALPTAEFELLAEERPEVRLVLSRNVRAPLTSHQKDRAGVGLAHIPLFAGLAPEVLEAVAERMVVRHVPAGELVFAEGTPGDAMFLVDSGQIEITASARRGSALVARLGDGEFFGEMALLTDKPRSNAARAATHSNLWLLHRSDFEDLVNRYPSISLALGRVLSERLAEMDRRFSETNLRRNKLLANLTSGQLEDISRRVQTVRFRQGEVFIREGEPGDEMFFIESGRVQVVRGTGRDAYPLAELGASEVVGEMALLTSGPRSATVVALTEVQAWALSKSDFDEVVSTQPNLALALSRLLSDRLRATGEQFVRRTVVPAAVEAPVAVAPARQHRSERAAPRPRRAPAERGRLRTNLREGFGNLAAWFGSLSQGARVRVVALTLLFIWLTCIALPALLISTLAAADVTDLRGAIAFVQSEPPAGAPAGLALEAPMAAQAIAAPQSMTRAQPEAVAMALADMPEEEEELWGLDADPVEQQVLAAEEPAPDPPTATPWIIVVTNTPPPPTVTPVPTETPLPPTATPRPAAAAAPVRPAATATPVPRALPPRDLDPRLPALNVGIVEPGGLQPGQSYWRLVRAYWQNKEESGNQHNIYIEVLDENGSRIVGTPVEIVWGSGSLTVYVEDKPAPEFGANFPMYATLGSYDVFIPGMPSDRVVGMGMGTPDQPNFTIHTNFLLTFQRTTW